MLTDAGCGALARLTGLTRLAMPRSPRVGDAGLKALAAGLGGPGCVLASLDLAASGVTDGGLSTHLPAFAASLEHAVLPPPLHGGQAGREKLATDLRGRGGMARLRWLKWGKW